MFCPVCNKEIEFDKKNKCFPIFCSNECRRSTLGKKIIAEKTKQSLILKYGKDYFKELGKRNKNKTDAEKQKIKEKREETNNMLYGVKNTFQSEDKKEKSKQTSLQNYGKEHYTQTEEYKERYKQTCIEKYNTDNVAKNQEIQLKILKTKRNNYWNSFLLLLKNKFIDTTFNKDEYINSKIGDILKFKCLKCDAIFDFEISNNQGIEVKDITCPNHKYSSNAEYEIKEFLNGITVEINKRFYYDKNNFHEIDIFLPDYNIGIEHHGLYWHSDLYHNKDYHRNKYLFFKEKEICLIQIFENEWLDKKEIVKSIIKSKLKMSNTIIYARKCNIKLISNSIYKEFCDLNHIQGYCHAKIKLGLFYNEELVQIMSFSKPRYNKEYNWENIRTCSKLNTSIVGGFSKLLKYFKSNYEGSIITYVDCRYFSGDGYVGNGFSIIKHSSPNYFYFKNKKISLESRNKYQKHKLKDILPIFDENLTEYENMLNNGYLRIYDAGNLVLVHTAS